MKDCHIHIERGAYTEEWIEKFVETAQMRGLDEIWLLEHCYRFREFAPMYDKVCAQNSYIDTWLRGKAGVLELSDYLRLVEQVRKNEYPVAIRFGLEVCYFQEEEARVSSLTKGAGLDFLVGSVHFVESFAFDHKPELWAGIDVDAVYRRYFDISNALAVSGLFDGIAHPDCIKLFGHKPSFSLLPAYETLARTLAEQGMYAEQSGGIALRGTCGAQLGMNADFLLACKKEGVSLCTASDAHRPEDVGRNIEQLELLCV